MRLYSTGLSPVTKSENVFKCIGYIIFKGFCTVRFYNSWNAFKESISTSGIVEPIVVTQDMIIVSGHQRVRAAKELGLSTIMVDIRTYENDDKVLKDLIETNIRQRGIGNPNPVKLGRCIKELERISLPAYNKRKIEKTICKNNLPFVFVLT